MQQKIRNLKFIQLSLLLSFFTASLVFNLGCSSQEKTAAPEKTITTEQDIQILDKEMALARAQNVDLLSSQNFESASRFFVEAKKALSEGKPDSLIQHQLTSARNYLRLASESAHKDRSKFSTILTARQLAINEGAAAYYDDTFFRVDNLFKKMVLARNEKDKLNSEKSRQTLSGIYQKLEVEAIKRQHLNDAKTNLNLAIAEGGRNMAPLTLSSALRDYKDSLNYIDQYPEDKIRIRELAREANQSAYLALQVTRENQESQDTISTRQSGLQRSH